MKLNLDVTPSSLVAVMRQEIAAGERAVSRATAKAGDGLKQDWRRQVTSAGLGARLAKTIRSRGYPRGRDSINAAALVWSKAPEIISSFDEGTVIRSTSGFWLAIPTEAAGRGRGGARLTPGEWERRRGIQLRLVYRRNQPSLLVADKARINKRGLAVESRAKTGRNQVTAPIFVLVPQVRLDRRLNLDRAVRRWSDRIPGMIVDEWVSDRTGIGGDG